MSSFSILIATKNGKVYEILEGVWKLTLEQQHVGSSRVMSKGMRDQGNAV